jgi:hypothetical protein
MKQRNKRSILYLKFGALLAVKVYVVIVIWLFYIIYHLPVSFLQDF